jgi:DnaJ-class molecular chaperone
LTFPDSPNEVVFILREKRHPKFHREGNDLHISMGITRQQAKDGCELTIELLDGKDLSIKLPGGHIEKSGQTIRVQGQGWPIRKTGMVPKET